MNSVKTFNDSVDVRRKIRIRITFASMGLFMLICAGFIIQNNSIQIDLLMKNTSPSFSHLFGTDSLGRDMLLRTLNGLSLSFLVGVVGAFSSTVIALFMSLIVITGEKMNQLVTWLIDLFLSMPHLVMLILISFMLGGGFKGVVVGIALTHWPMLTRLLRAEALQIKSRTYVSLSHRFGKPKGWIIRHHYIPHLLPQLMIGFILLFPHAILHEAAITFLGFGLPSETPAIGIILSESMRYLTIGAWWLAFFPGLILLLMVGLFDFIGRQLRQYFDPFDGQRGY